MEEKTKTVPEALKDLGRLYEQRSAVYGDNYTRFGPAFMAIFPGVQIKCAHDMNRFALFVMIFSKISRYAQQFHAGGHADSLDDISVYAQMLQRLDTADPEQIYGFKGADPEQIHGLDTAEPEKAYDFDIAELERIYGLDIADVEKIYGPHKKA